HRQGGGASSHPTPSRRDQHDGRVRSRAGLHPRVLRPGAKRQRPHSHSHRPLPRCAGHRFDPAEVKVMTGTQPSTEEKGVVMDDMRYDVAVVGAGQAGLAIGHALAEQEKRFVILEAANSVGSAWRNRWDSLVLFTSRRYDGLPGLAFPGDPGGYPTRDEVASYLERYAEQFELPVELSTPVRSLNRDADG